MWLYRLLDSFHDLNKIICQRFTRANGISRELLLKTLQLEQQQTVSKNSQSKNHVKTSVALAVDSILFILHRDLSVQESQASTWTANRRLSPGLPTAHRHPHNAAAKRRLSYDYNRNILV